MQQPTNDEPLKVETSLDLLLVLLFAPGRSGKPGDPIDGITRLQKLMFLLQQGDGPAGLVEAAQAMFYKPYKMGPFSRELYDDIDMLTSLGFLRTEQLDYVITDDQDPSQEQEQKVVQSTRYLLTTAGMEAGKDLFDALSKVEAQGLVKFKEFFNAIPLRQLLIFVYKKYPKYTTASTIRGTLGL